MKILHVICSPRGQASESRRLSQKIIGFLLRREPAAMLSNRVIGGGALSHIDESYATALGATQQSPAEMFPAGFRALGLGKVVGTPTMGAVIGTGSYSLIDGSTVRTPGVGVFLADPKRTNMENYGVQPDMLVDNRPEDTLAGRDRQLEAAVDELMKQLNGTRRNTTTDGQK